MQLRKWPKLAYPIFVWTTFCLLFISTLADPQTQTVSTGTSVNADALVSVIAVAESLRAASSDELLIGSSIPATPTSNGLLIGTATLTAGGPQYTTESYTISLGQSGILEVNGQTTSLPPGVPATQTTEAGEFTIGSNIIATRASTNAVHIGTATLTAGGPEITTSTYTLSLGPSGILDVNSETTSLAPLIPVVQTTSSDTPQSVVTSTMTSAPPDVSTQIIHPPGISTNKWVTTSKDGESTVVPGIWCNSCAPGDDSGIVLVWNFPKLRFTEFDWPSFPGLGKFHLPCIQLFGVAVTDCPPPQSDEESGSEDGSDNDDNDNDNNNDENNDEDDDQDDEQNDDQEDDQENEQEDNQDGNEEDDDEEEEECTSSTTVTNCEVGCRETQTTAQDSVSTSTICYTTTCTPSEGCDLRPTITSTISTAEGPSCTPPTPTPFDMWASYSSRGLQIPIWVEGARLPVPTDVAETGLITSSSQSSPVTSFISRSTQQPDPGAGINSGYCVCDGSTVEVKTTDSPTPNSCAYTAVPKSTIDPTVSSSVRSISSVCQACTYVGNLAAQCKSISDCTSAATEAAPTASTSGPAVTGASPTEAESSPPYPTSTDSTGGTSADSALCHETVDPDDFSVFTMDEARKAYNSVFDRGIVLTPGQTFAYSEGSPIAAGDQVLASVEWAADQSDCQPKADFEVSGEDCENAFINIMNTCVGSGGRGGDFVYKSPQGCVHFTLEARS